MCAVSMIYDYSSTRPIDYWTKPRITELQKLVDAAKEFDIKTQQPPCEDPKKEEFFKQILDRLDKIEKKIG